jgi:hypothetical protein
MPCSHGKNHKIKRSEIFQKALFLLVMVLVAHKQNFGSTTQANALAHQEVWLHRNNFRSIVLQLGINFELSNNKCQKHLQHNHSCPILQHMVCFSLLTRFRVQDNYCVSPAKRATIPLPFSILLIR